jgi:hypothetical protein
MRTEWQGDEFAILVTRDEVKRARRREQLLDVLVSEELASLDEDASLEVPGSLPDDPRLRDLMDDELRHYADRALQALRAEASKGGTREEVLARFHEHFDADTLELSQSLSEIIARESISYDDAT